MQIKIYIKKRTSLIKFKQGLDHRLKAQGEKYQEGRLENEKKK